MGMVWMAGGEYEVEVEMEVRVWCGRGTDGDVWGYHDQGRVVVSCPVVLVQYSTVLYCTVLYCTVLYCTVLYCTVRVVLVLYLNRWSERFPMRTTNILGDFAAQGLGIDQQSVEVKDHEAYGWGAVGRRRGHGRWEKKETGERGERRGGGIWG